MLVASPSHVGFNAASVSGSATYAVNALGQRVKKVLGGNASYFVYDEAGHLIGEYDNSGNLIQETVWLDDIPVVTLRPDGSGGVNVFYVHTDHLNTPRRISRPSDNVVLWRWDSDPFGSAAANQDPDADSTNFVYNLRFPGQYYDAETGLNYNYFRDYDAQTGRYVQSDPAGLHFSLNTYAYLDGNPVDGTDPLGLGRATNPHPRPTRAAAFGCIGFACANGRMNGPGDPQVSLELALGGGIEICEEPKPDKPACGESPKKRKCSPYDPACDNSFEYPGIPMPAGLGLLIGGSVKRDGRVCIRLGVFVELPVPTYELGSLYEHYR